MAVRLRLAPHLKMPKKTKASRRKDGMPVKQSVEWEHNLQSSAFTWYLQHVKPLGGCEIRAIPNANKRTAAQAGFLREEGMVDGTSDWFIMLPQGRTVWAEWKLGDRPPWHEKTYQQPSQKAFQATCERFGHPYVVLRSLEELYDLLAAEGVPMGCRPIGNPLSPPARPPARRAPLPPAAPPQAAVTGPGPADARPCGDAPAGRASAAPSPASSDPRPHPPAAPAGR